MRFKNPYITGNPVGNSPTFVGRADIVQKVQEVMPQQNAIVLYGQRRIGKTSILQELEAQLSQEGPYQPVFFDLQDKAQWPLERVLKTLAQQISDSLGQSTPNLGTDPKFAFSTWLSERLNNFPSQRLVLLFDELDVLADQAPKQAGETFFSELGKLLNNYPEQLKSILVIGRTTRDLNNNTLSFFKNRETLKVSLLDYDDTVKLICLSNNNGLNWSDDTKEAVWQLTNGHPYLTQCLCSSIWERLYSQNPNEPPTVALKDVQVAVPDALISSYHVLEWLWNGLPPAERVVASALADAPDKTITQIELERRLSQHGGIKTLIRKLENAPHLLQDWDIIEATDDNEGYCFRVELVRRWIVEYKPFYQEQNKLLAGVDPKADSLYQKAYELYDKGYLEEAVGLLKGSIESNPHHVRANQLLSDILFEQKKYHEAYEVLEKLYAYQAVAARFRLIQVLLVLAKSSDSEIEQLNFYEHLLELDAKHPEAHNQLNKLRSAPQKQRGLLFRKPSITTPKYFVEFFKVKKLALLVGVMSLIAVLLPYFPDGYTYLGCLQGWQSESENSCERFWPWKNFKEYENQLKSEINKNKEDQKKIESLKKQVNKFKKTTENYERQLAYAKKTKREVMEELSKLNKNINAEVQKLMTKAINKGGNVTDIAKPYLDIITYINKLIKKLSSEPEQKQFQNSSLETVIFITQLSFMDTRAGMPLESSLSTPINQAVREGVELAQQNRSYIKLNASGHQIDNSDHNVNEFINFFLVLI